MEKSIFIVAATSDKNNRQEASESTAPTEGESRGQTRNTQARGRLYLVSARSLTEFSWRLQDCGVGEFNRRLGRCHAVRVNGRLLPSRFNEEDKVNGVIRTGFLFGPEWLILSTSSTTVKLKDEPSLDSTHPGGSGQESGRSSESRDYDADQDILEIFN